jgi:anaerobic selenocysteine-containing dehydrogenase
MLTKRAICEACDIRCNVLVQVDGDKVKKIKANPNHPVTPNSICNKGITFIEAQNHPDRILYPMKRVGERGSGKWERITWEQANKEIGERLLWRDNLSEKSATIRMILFGRGIGMIVAERQ